MFVTYRLLLAGHIACACAAVAAFWAAAAARKGSTGHVRTGKVYVAAMTALAVSALGLSALNVVAPEAVHSLEEFRARGTTLGADMASATTADLAREFRLNAIWLTYAALQLVVGLRFGTQVVRTRRVDARALVLDALLAGLISVSGIGLVAVGRAAGHPIITGMGVLGALSGGRRLFALLRPPASRMEWFYEHMGTMLATGIPLHVTLMLALGRHLPGPPGAWRVALPAVVVFGWPAITMLKRRYRRRLGLSPSPGHDRAVTRPDAIQPD